MIRATFFKNHFDINTDHCLKFSNWQRFVNFMKKLQLNEFTKEKAPLISPAIYKSDTTRKNANVDCWGSWAAVDVDSFQQITDNLENDIKQKYGEWTYACYSTASSTQEKPKFRLLFQLTEDIIADKIELFWYALNLELGDIIDPQTKDRSRMFYIPANYIGTNIFFYENTGNIINPNTLIEKHELSAVEAMKVKLTINDDLKEKILAYKKQMLENNISIKWSNYHNCPFVSKEILNEYRMISNTGWYRKLYQMMVSIARRAIKMGYPITPNEVEILIREIDADTGGWYTKRKIETEAARAVNFVYSDTHMV